MEQRPSSTRASNCRAACAVAAGLSTMAAAPLDPVTPLYHVTLGTGWLAQAEHGGFYQALADGTYASMGLDVTIAMGGPQTPNGARLIAGQIQFLQGTTLSALDAVGASLPIVTVAAIFQKDPQAILAHPDQHLSGIADLAGLKTLYLAGDGYDTYFRWLKSSYPGFRDDQYKPYSYSPAPFIVDPHSGQQAYITSEPYTIEKQAGWWPKAFLLADYGYDGYATTIETQQAFVRDHPDLVQRFVTASIIGWYHYLYGDNTAGNRLIKQDNPEMTDDQIAYTIGQFKAHGIIVSGDAAAHGIGCMTDARYRSFFDAMVRAKVLAAGLDYRRAYTTQFVCKDVGKNLVKAP